MFFNLYTDTHQILHYLMLFLFFWTSVLLSIITFPSEKPLLEYISWSTCVMVVHTLVWFRMFERSFVHFNAWKVFWACISGLTVIFSQLTVDIVWLQLLWLISVVTSLPPWYKIFVFSLSALKILSLSLVTEKIFKTISW